LFVSCQPSALISRWRSCSQIIPSQFDGTVTAVLLIPQTNNLQMATFLKIENVGVCPVEGFILLGATSKRLADNDSPYTVGQFGSGNKHALNVLLRANLNPTVFCGNHRLEFTTKPGKMKALEGETAYN